MTLLQTGTGKAELPEIFKKHLTNIHDNIVMTYNIIGGKQSDERPNLKEIREILTYHEKTLRSARAVLSVEEVTHPSLPPPFLDVLRIFMFSFFFF